MSIACPLCGAVTANQTTVQHGYTLIRQTTLRLRDSGGGPANVIVGQSGGGGVIDTSRYTADSLAAAAARGDLTELP